jgi:hypothetical protein
MAGEMPPLWYELGACSVQPLSHDPLGEVADVC